MIKKHKRKQSGGMRRTSRIFLNHLNAGKTQQLIDFLLLHAQVIRYFLEMFWSDGDLSANLADKSMTDKARERFHITARLAQMAAKQAKEMVRSQQKKSKKTQRMPKFRNISVNIDRRGVTITPFQGNGFDLALTFASGIPPMIVPLNHTKHSKKFLNEGWTLSHSIRLGLKNGRVWVDLMFEKPKPELKTEGETVGIDIGYRHLMATSRKEILGDDVKQQIERAGKRRKGFHRHIQTEIKRTLKQLDLSNVKTIVLENLKHVKRGKRGTFSRRVNRFLSFWHYARVIDWLRQQCEEQGIRVEMKSPWKTSQHCPQCGKIDKKNRKKDRFTCVQCGFSEHADIVGGMNLKLLSVAGVYSLRFLKAAPIL